MADAPQRPVSTASSGRLPLAEARAPARTYYGIELLRFVTAAAVLVFHYQHFYTGSGTEFDITQQPFYSALSLIYRYGYFGVQIFWCISGFIFFARYGQSVGSGAEPVRSFAVARFSRLYPLHLLTLLAVAVMQWIYTGRHGIGFIYQNNDWPHFAAQFVMASSWRPSFGPSSYSFNGPIWSVSLEIAAYVVFFAVTRFFGSSIVTVLATLVGAAALDAVLGHHPVFSCIIYFYVGAAMYRLSAALHTLRRRRVAVAVAVVAACAAAVLASASKLSPSLATLVLSPAALLVAALAFERSGPAFGRISTVLGNTTYASYLLHFPLQLLCVLVFEQWAVERPLTSGWCFGAFIVGTFLLSIACHRWVEWPAQQWLRRRLRRGMLPPAR